MTWIEYAKDHWKLTRGEGEKPVALVRPSANDAGMWFWECWPFMGQYGTVATMEDAKRVAGWKWREEIEA